MKFPLVSLIVINWNGEKLLRGCIDSLLKTDYDNLELIVVDNNSSDNSIEILETYGNKVRIIQNRENSGYAKGCNIGIHEAHGKYISTLNNDIAVEPDWLRKAVDFLEKNRTVGGISPRQMNYFDRDKIDILFSVVHRDLSFIPYLDGVEWRGQVPASYVISINGASAVWRAEMLKELHGFNEIYHSFYEETDLCFRALTNGWKFVFLPDVIVYHMRSVSYKSVSSFMFYLGQRNRRIMLLNNYPIIYLLKKSPLLLTIEIYRFILQLLRREMVLTYSKALVHSLLYFFSFKWVNYKKAEIGPLSYYQQLRIKLFINL